MKKRRGIRRQITFTVTLLVIASLVLLGLALSGLIFINQKNQLHDLQHEVANYAVNEMAWDTHEIESLLNLAITSYDLLSLNAHNRFNILSQLLNSKDIKRHDILDELVLLDSDGRELTRVSRTIVFSASELGERADADEFLIPKRSGKLHYGPLIFDETTYEPMITLSLPILDVRSGAVTGVLLGSIRLNRVWENVVERPFGKSGSIFITNSDGKVVAHRDPSVVYRNTFYKAETPEGIQTGLNGKRVLLVGKKFHLGDQPFVLYTALPFREVLTLSLQTVSFTSVFLFACILLSVTVSFIAVNRIVRPIESLADDARKISAGKLVAPVPVGNADEIGDLSSAFNIMTSKLLETISSLEHQIDERKLAEEEIIKQNELLRGILNSLTHPFYVVDANDYTITLANDATGFDLSAGRATCYALTHQRDTPCDSSEHPCVIARIKETGNPVTVEHFHFDKEGKPLIMEVHGYPIFDSTGNIIQVIEYNLDITKRKTDEDRIMASLKEKEVLLREIHHRVKNNMQIISSLLNLQSSVVSDIRDVEMLKDSQNRIRSMSLIHEKLYGSEDLAHIDIRDYINDLTRYIFQFHKTVTDNVELKIEIENIWLGIDTAIPCGLIINELVSNSLKHAFPENRQGEIRVTLRKTDEGEIELIISDNGIGIPEGLDISSTKTLGLLLVNTLAKEQLQGKIELDRTKGTKFRITFKEVKY